MLAEPGECTRQRVAFGRHGMPVLLEDLTERTMTTDW
jgi:hypothetical protein